MRFAKILPTFRSRDGDRSDIRKNNDTFATAGGILSRGGTVILYPEAQHQHGRYLGVFKKGFPRICFAAEEISDYNLHLKILPVCLHYSHYEKLGAKLLIIVGTPFTFEEFYDTHRTDPNLAYNQLNEKTRAILKEMVIDIEDRENYDQYDTLRLMISKHRVTTQNAKHNFYQKFLEEKKIIEEIDQLKQEQPKKFEDLMDKSKQYQKGLKDLNLRDWLINSKVDWINSISKDIGSILLFPFFLFSLLNNGLVYYIPELMVKRLKDRQLFSTIRFALGFILSLFWYPILFIIVFSFTKSIPFSFIWVFSSILLFKLIFYWKKGVVKLFHTYRYLFLKKSKDLIMLKKLKEEILLFF